MWKRGHLKALNGTKLIIQVLQRSSIPQNINWFFATWYKKPALSVCPSHSKFICYFQDYGDEMLENTEKFDNFAVAGWGMTSASDRTSRTEDLMKLDLTFVNSPSCKRELKKTRIAPQPQPTSSQICASGERFVQRVSKFNL